MAEQGGDTAMADEQLELRWDPAAADWADALRAQTPMFRWAPWFALSLAGFSVLLVIVGELVPGIFGLACGALIALLPAVSVYLSFRRNPVAAATVTATVDDQSMRMMTIDGTAYTDLRWRTVAGWRETRRGFVLHGTDSATALYPVPARAFGSTAERNRFRDILTREIGPADRK
jgi:YcxB-like protein